MKIGIIGTGHVGCACALAAVIRGSAGEIVLVNRTRKAAEAVATDMRYGIPVGRKLEIVDGDYDDLAGAGVVLITSGVNEKTGGATDRSDPQGRLKLLDKNAGIYREIIPNIVKAAPGAVLVVVTDPPDPLADVARQVAPRAAVLSMGTFIDSQRFRVHLGKAFGVDPRYVEAQSSGITGLRRYSCGRRRAWAGLHLQACSSNEASSWQSCARGSSRVCVTPISRS
jgi:L-lactate dehydrogenase